MDFVIFKEEMLEKMRKMKIKKIIALFLSVLTVGSFALCNAGAVSVYDGKTALTEQFLYGEGPNVDGYVIDYRYFSPLKDETEEKANEETTVESAEEETEPETPKYPLVVWVHGHSFGQYDGYQIEATPITNWASDEYQARFGESGGAYIMAVRAPEDDGISWNDDLIRPLKFAIDDFILKNSETIDTSRIYIGGFSLGGMMTFKMCMAYPEMFAAIFPICPHIKLEASEASSFSSVPVWLVSGKNDALVSYRGKTLKNWKAVVSTTAAAESCRLSTLTDVREPDGSLAPSAHYSWIAVCNDMFSRANGDYPDMITVNGLGKSVTLTYPDGMISWLLQFSSRYSIVDIDISDTGGSTRNLSFFKIIKALFMMVYIPLRNIIRGGNVG